MNRYRSPFGPIVVLGALLLASACGSEDSGDDGRLYAVTTIGMIADIVEVVGGDRVRVDGLMGPGVDPHLYKASAGDIRRLTDADVIFYNGLHLEAAMADVLEEMSGRQRTVAVTDEIDPSLLKSWPAYPDLFDPHVWFDVTLWMRAVERVRDTLIEMDPDGAEGYRDRTDRYLAEMEELHTWVLGRAGELPEERRLVVTAHDAFAYFGSAYGFEVSGLLGISTATEAGTGDVQGLADLIVERRLPAIFVETSVPRRTIEAVQAAVSSRGFEVEIGGALFSDAMGNPGTPEGTYLGMVRHNVNTIVDALLAEPETTEQSN